LILCCMGLTDCIFLEWNNFENHVCRSRDGLTLLLQNSVHWRLSNALELYRYVWESSFGDLFCALVLKWRFHWLANQFLAKIIVCSFLHVYNCIIFIFKPTYLPKFCPRNIKSNRYGLTLHVIVLLYHNILMWLNT